MGQYDDQERLSPFSRDLIQRMLTLDPKERFTAAQILEHDWLKGVSLPEVTQTHTNQFNQNDVIWSKMQNFKETSKFKKIVL